MKRLLVGLLTAGLVGCAAVGDIVSGGTPAQKVFAATGVYDAALSVAVAYKKLPACTLQPKPVLCSDASVVATLQKADNVAFEALSTAQKIVRTPASTESALAAAARWAQEAVGAFGRLTSTLSTK